MASAEIQLPRDPLEDQERNSVLYVAADDIQHHHRGESSASEAAAECGAHDAITWHYLTFETELPVPSHLSEASPAQGRSDPPPEPPELRKYASPFLWPESRKSFMLLLSCVATIFTAYNAGACQYFSTADARGHE